MTQRGRCENSESTDSRTNAQSERARQAWELFVAASLDELPEEERRALLRILRVKRSERSAFAARLPGVVRRGARGDLEPIEARLRDAGLKCALRRNPSSR